MTLLSKSDQEAVAAAINEVERETDAELVTVLTAQSDNYSYIPLLWAGILALLVPGIANYFGNWLGADMLMLVQWGTFILLSLLFRLAQAFGVFDLIQVLTGGGPAGSTESLALYAYLNAMRFLDFGYSATVMLGGFLLLTLFIVLAGLILRATRVINPAEP